jgi:hypothetical protein
VHERPTRIWGNERSISPPEDPSSKMPSGTSLDANMCTTLSSQSCDHCAAWRGVARRGVAWRGVTGRGRAYYVPCCAAPRRDVT